MADGQMTTDDAPMLGGLVDDLITGDEPMLSGRFDLRRLGSMQRAFIGWLQGMFGEADEVSLLAAWRWVDDYTGNAYVKRKWRDDAKRWTSARLARLLHSFIRRGLILVVKHEDGYNFIRSRDKFKRSEDNA